MGSSPRPRVWGPYAAHANARIACARLRLPRKMEEASSRLPRRAAHLIQLTGRHKARPAATRPCRPARHERVQRRLRQSLRSGSVATTVRTQGPPAGRRAGARQTRVNVLREASRGTACAAECAAVGPRRRARRQRTRRRAVRQAMPRTGVPIASSIASRAELFDRYLNLAQVLTGGPLLPSSAERLR